MGEKLLIFNSGLGTFRIAVTLNSEHGDWEVLTKRELQGRL
jgi:hypothetical protein